MAKILFMSSTEITSVPQIPEASNDAIFSLDTRKQALSVLEHSHGGLVAAIWAPARNFIDWLTNRQGNAEEASNVIDARARFNRAAISATSLNNDLAQEKQTA